MKTKFLMILAAVVMFGGAVCAQEKKQAPTQEQKIEKRVERMQKRLLLDDATAKEFAPIYKEYLTEKIAVRPQCGKCKNPTDAQIKENISKRLDAEQKNIEIEKKYYKKLSTLLSGRQLQQIFCKDNKNAAYGKGKPGVHKAKMRGGKVAPRCGKKSQCCVGAVPACSKADAKCSKAADCPKAAQCPKVADASKK